MPRKKAVEPKKRKPRVRRLVEESLPKNAERDLVRLPVFGGITVLEVLDFGHTKVFFHCRGRDKGGNSITLHVPRELFQ